MKKNLLHRVIIILVVTLVSLWVVVGPRRRPTAEDFTWRGINNTLRENIRLGLDLRGGSHLVMQVKVEDYLGRLTTNAVTGIQRAAAEGGYNLSSVTPQVEGNNFRIVAEVADPAKVNEVRDQLPQKVNDFDPTMWESSVSGNRVTWTMRDAAKGALGDRAVEDALRIIDTRINAIGVAEPTLQRHGAENSRQILLQMPGIDDPERVKKMLAGESRLELVHVINTGGQSTYPTREAAVAALGGAVPQNRRVLEYIERDEPTTAGGRQGDSPQAASQWVVAESPPVIEGNDLRSSQATPGDGAGDDYQINFNLKPAGADKFGRWTAANVGQLMGVVLDDKVRSVATIQSQINDSGRITGNFTKESAEDLALTLRSGALPAKLVYLEERTVGPSLGQDSIRAGVTASLVGLALVVLFMVFYYRGSGVNAVVALLLNMIITLAALVVFDATLTLPGIAGIILSIGMAVDSNVLIFERIREELRTGKTVASAVEQGFARAFTTIIDTHVTTIVAALFLFVFGTGPIRGFAVTLILSLLANLFSAVYVSRTIFIWVLSRRGRRAESLSI
jgi:preprotein translocase subunit SecD